MLTRVVVQLAPDLFRGCLAYLGFMPGLLVDLEMFVVGIFCSPHSHSANLKTWHIRRVWSFAPFVVVVGSKYFLPAPVCLLFDWGKFGSDHPMRCLPHLPAPLVREGFDAWR